MCKTNKEHLVNQQRHSLFKLMVMFTLLLLQAPAMVVNNYESASSDAIVI